jgi:hypothetical protein
MDEEPDTYREKILHFDNVDGIANHDQAFTKRNTDLGGFYANRKTHTFNSNIPIAMPIRNVNSVSLKTFETLMTIDNIRNSNGSDQFNFTWGGVHPTTSTAYTNRFHTGSLRNTNFSTIQSLLTNLNDSFALSFWDVMGTFQPFYITALLNPNDPSKIIFKTNCLTQLSFTQGIFLRDIIGVHPQDFSFIEPSDGLRYLYCTNNWNLQPDNYLNLTITNLQVAPTNANNKQSSFKISINESWGQVIHYTVIMGQEQTLYIDRSGVVLDRANIELTDRWGFGLWGKGSQMSFSLLIGYKEL